MKKTLLYISSALVLLAVVIGGAGTHLSRVDAQVVQGALNGWGWSDTIGWISFNCLTGSSSGGSICGTSNYAVSEDASGNLSGYAWSDNIGWIKFGGLSGFPSGGGASSNAKVDATTGNLSGWAQAVAGAGRSDGWDGWISLSGLSADSSTYGVNANSTSGLFTGYAWGSDVVGWVTLNAFGATGTCDPTKQVCVTQTLSPVVNLLINGGTSATIATGTTAQLSWGSANGTINIDTTKTCAISGDTTATVPAGVITYTVGPFSTTAGSPHAYMVTCTATPEAGGTSTPSNNVSLAVAAVTGPGGQTSMCAPVSNATLCTGEGSSTLPLSGSTAVSACSTAAPAVKATMCEYLCNTGFRQLGKTCVLNSTIQEN